MKAAALVCSAACVILAIPRAAAGQQPPDIPVRAQGADRVVLATVIDVNGAFARSEHGDQIIVSQVQLQVEETLKGGAREMALVIEVEGGTVGDLTMGVSDLPALERGERAVFFLRRAANGRLVPHLRGHGIIELDEQNRARGSSLTLDMVRAMVAGARQ